MSTSFAAICRDASDWIKHGGLKDDDDASQVENESFPWLAKINALGFLTVDSQDGQSSQNYAERAYVYGFMKTSKAFALVEKLNNTSDKVCIVIQPCQEWKKSHIPLTQSRGVTHTSLPLYTDTSIPFLKNNAGIAHVIHVSFVFAFDPLWSRKAYGKHGLWRDVVRALGSL
jgi:hypothetical protein